MGVLGSEDEGQRLAGWMGIQQTVGWSRDHRFGCVVQLMML